MNRRYKEYLFRKNILVSEQAEEDGSRLDVLYALVKQFGIHVVSGGELATREMIPFSESMLGIQVPEPFYRGFPQSVRALSPDQLLFDQLVHYSVTYGFGDFSEPGHSLWEHEFERLAFRENAEVRDFEIVTEEEAERRMEEAVKALCASTRPLSPLDFELVSQYVTDRGRDGLAFASQDLRIRLRKN